MTGREALEELKEYSLVSYDEDGNEEDCISFGRLEPNIIEALEKDLKALETLRKHITLIDYGEGYSNRYAIKVNAFIFHLTEEQYKEAKEVLVQ